MGEFTRTWGRLQAVLVENNGQNTQIMCLLFHLQNLTALTQRRNPTNWLKFVQKRPVEQVSSKRICHVTSALFPPFLAPCTLYSPWSWVRLGWSFTHKQLEIWAQKTTLKLHHATALTTKSWSSQHKSYTSLQRKSVGANVRQVLFLI